MKFMKERERERERKGRPFTVQSELPQLSQGIESNRKK